MALPTRSVQPPLPFGNQPSAMTATERMEALNNPSTSEAALRVSKARPRAAYHLNRDVPAHLLARPGATDASVPTPHLNGVQFRPVEVAQPRGSGGAVSHIQHHEMERTNYPVPEGQMTIGPPSKPEAFGQVDRHGNQVDHSRATADLYSKYGPFLSAKHDQWWNENAPVHQVDSTSLLHTAQPATGTGTHSYVAGPLDKSSPAGSVLIHNGVPHLIDGHHRVAEYRGRGEPSFPARVLNLDQYRDQIAAEHKAPSREAVDVNPGKGTADVSYWNRQKSVPLP